MTKEASGGPSTKLDKTRRERRVLQGPPPGPAPALASTSGPAQRGAALLPRSDGQRTASARGAGRRRGRERARGGAGRGGQGWPTRIALGIPTAAIRHTATQALSGGRAKVREQLARCRSVSLGPGRVPFLSFLSPLPEPARNLNQTSPAHRHSQNGEHYSPHADIFTSRHDRARSPAARASSDCTREHTLLTCVHRRHSLTSRIEEPSFSVVA